MLRDIARGMAAGAAGTTALDIVGYVDMAIRGRGASSVPSKIADTVLHAVGIELPGEAKDSAEDTKSKKTEGRLAGLGALMGYGVGLGIGGLYGLVRPRLGKLSVPVAGAAIGLAAMAASDAPAVATHVTDPKTWGASGWLSDIIPHLIYGLVTAAVYESWMPSALPAWRVRR